MKNLAAPLTMFAHDIFASAVTQGHRLGTPAETNDGRRFRYASIGVLDTVAGNCYQSSVPVVQHLANTPPVVNIGDTSFLYTPGAAAGAANLYAEGFLQVDTTPGNGYVYQVSGHGPISSGVAFILNLMDPIQVALSAASKVGLRAHAYRNIVVAPVTLTSKIVGVPGAIISAGQYGWIQTRGIASLLINGTPGIGLAVVNSATVPGAVDVITTTNLLLGSVVGYMLQAGVNGKNNFVDLQID